MLDTVGDRIKHLRKNQKMTQKEFSEKVGIARSTLAGYESNQIEPSLNVIFKISNTFNVRPSYFLKTMAVEYPVRNDDLMDIASKLDDLMDKISSSDILVNNEVVKHETDISRIIYHEIKKTRDSIIHYTKILQKR